MAPRSDLIAPRTLIAAAFESPPTTSFQMRVATKRAAPDAPDEPDRQDAVQLKSRSGRLVKPKVRDHTP